MRYFDGTLIHQEHDHLGAIQVVDDGIYRSLHFDSVPRQSSMLIQQPQQLVLRYTRLMCASLLFTPSPQRLLLFGLGGGSLAKFFLQYYPHCHIDAVELRPSVHQLAQRFFHLPDSPNLNVHYADAGSFIRDSDPQHFANYDLILVDAFLDSGIAYAVCGSHFSDLCHQRLSHSGVLAFNLWLRDRHSSDDHRQQISASFHGNLLSLPVPEKENIILIATRQGHPRRQLKHLTEKAEQLQQHTTLEFPNMLRALRRANRFFF